MKANQHDMEPRPYMYPGIFGPMINDWGLREAIENFDTTTRGHPDSVKVNHKTYMLGIMEEFDQREPSPKRQRQWKIYLDELDRRRGTDWTKIYPQMYEEIKKIL